MYLEGESEKTIPKTIIRANGQFKLKWDILILVLSIWNCFSIPVDIAF